MSACQRRLHQPANSHAPARDLEQIQDCLHNHTCEGTDTNIRAMIIARG